MERAHDVIAQWGWHDDARRVATFIHVSQEATFNDESVPDVEVLLKSGVELYLIGVWFASGVDATHHSSQCRVRALLVKPVSP